MREEKLRGVQVRFEIALFREFYRDHFQGIKIKGSYLDLKLIGRRVVEAYNPDQVIK